MSFNRALLYTASFICLSFAASAETPPPPAAAIPTPPAANPAAPPAAMPRPTPAPAAAPAGVTRQELPALIKETLMNDPDIIMQAIQKLREKQAEEAKQKASEVLTKRKDDLLNDASSPSIGDAKTADVTVVEFFDYHCGYCRRMMTDLTKIISEDKKLRVVFKEFPILGEDSVAASRMSLAVSRLAKDKYFEFHSALMKHEGKFDEKSMLEIAKKLGINGEKLKAEAAKPEITAILDKNRALGEDMGIRGTPAFVIGNEFTPGAMGYDDLKKAIDAARGGKKPDEVAAPAAAPAAAPTAAPAPAAKPAAAPAPAPAAKPAAAPAAEKAAPAVAVPVTAPAPAAPVPPPPAPAEGK